MMQKATKIFTTLIKTSFFLFIIRGVMVGFIFFSRVVFSKEDIIFHNMCPDEEKCCSARNLVITESRRGENLLSNDIKYVMIE